MKQSKIVTLKLSPSTLQNFSIKQQTPPKKKTGSSTPAEDNTTSTNNKGPSGPKSNTGAINANLRALDRSGAPARKWTRQPIQLKSFTGVKYSIDGWFGGQKDEKQDQNEQNNTSSNSIVKAEIIKEDIKTEVEGPVM